MRARRRAATIRGRMNIICLVVDRLHVGYLGCYGNTWISTPEFDRLAAESLTFDQAMTDSPDLATVYESFWLGRTALEQSAQRAVSRRSFAKLLSSAGLRCALMTDDEQLIGHPLAADFGECTLMRSDEAGGSSEEAAPADEIGGTRLAVCFAEATDWLSRASSPFCLWLHIGSIGAIWDAPLTLRNQYADLDDPQPPAGANVPNEMLPQDYDPDSLLGVCQAYAGQISLLDTCLGGLMEAIRQSPARDETLFAMTSARGFPLGEHRRIGPVDDALYGELVHTPLWLRFPDGRGAAARTQGLVLPADLSQTLLGWSRAGSWPGGAIDIAALEDSNQPGRDRACVISPRGERALRTASWHARFLPDEGDTGQVSGELYAKPDDRWEVNDVSGRCAGILESMSQAWRDAQQAAESNDPCVPSALDETVR